MASIFDKLEPVIKRYDEIEGSMAEPEVAMDFSKIQELAKERAGLEKLVGISRQHTKLVHDRGDLASIIQEGSDPELADMAREELEGVDAAI